MMTSFFHAATTTATTAAKALTTPAPIPIISPVLSFFPPAFYFSGLESPAVEVLLDPVLEISRGLLPVDGALAVCFAFY